MTPADDDAGVAGVCVAGHVGQPLLHNAIDARFHLRRQTIVQAAHHKIHLNPVTPAEVFDVVLEGHLQPQIVERAGTQTPRQRAHFLQRVAHHVAQLIDLGTDAVVGHSPLEILQAHQE